MLVLVFWPTNPDLLSKLTTPAAHSLASAKTCCARCIMPHAKIQFPFSPLSHEARSSASMVSMLLFILIITRSMFLTVSQLVQRDHCSTGVSLLRFWGFTHSGKKGIENSLCVSITPKCLLNIAGHFACAVLVPKSFLSGAILSGCGGFLTFLILSAFGILGFFSIVFEDARERGPRGILRSCSSV